jgi:hypothetical protein
VRKRRALSTPATRRNAALLRDQGLWSSASFYVNFSSMNYRRHTGPTETFSVTVDKRMKKALKARADRLYAGNMSALISDLGREAERAEAVARLIRRAGGSTLTDARRDEIDAQLEAGWRRARTRTKSAKKSAKRRAA